MFATKKVMTVWTAEGWLYVAAVVDLFSQKLYPVGTDRKGRR
jgi:hypothetical protein